VKLRPEIRRRAAVCVGLVLAFGVGTAFGQALGDNSTPSGTQTLVRTLHPLPLAPAARETVTITVQNP
jgi:drug/metabolite transporter (DMT)-like permease